MLGLIYTFLQTPLTIATFNRASHSLTQPFNILAHLNFIVIPCTMLVFVKRGSIK